MQRDICIKPICSSSKFAVFKLWQDKTKNIKSKKGLLPNSFDTYQIVKDGIIVMRFTDLQNDHKSLRIGLAKKKASYLLLILAYPLAKKTPLLFV